MPNRKSPPTGAAMDAELLRELREVRRRRRGQPVAETEAIMMNGAA